MDTLVDIPTVTHVIQQALTPVFLIGGVGTLLNVLTGRLARIVDRYRFLSEVDAGHRDELLNLPFRVRLIHRAISLCCVCVLLVCLSIVILFMGAELQLNISRITSLLFVAAMLTLTVGITCFLREIALATKNMETIVLLKY